jgi:hypothetical protein
MLRKREEGGKGCKAIYRLMNSQLYTTCFTITEQCQRHPPSKLVKRTEENLQTANTIQLFLKS